MMENSHKRIVTIAIVSVIVLLVVISLLPFNTVSYETTETYYEAGVKQETYVTKEPYISKEMVDKQEDIFNDRPYSVPYGINVPFVITKSDAELFGHFELPGSGGIRILLPSSKILYEQLGQQGDFHLSLPNGNYTAVLRDSIVWGKPVYLSLVLKWTELGEVTKYREVTKNREVPVKVEKQRPTTRHKNASLWELIFGITPR